MSLPICRFTSQREKQRTDTHKRIYEAALAEFRRVGFANAQIDKIARVAGVVRGTFYFHFPRKEDVLLELVQTLGSEISDRLVELSQERPSVRTILTGVIDGVVAGIAAVSDYGLIRDLLSAYVGQPPGPTVIEQSFPLAGELERLLADAAERGELRDDLCPDRLAIMFMTFVFGTLLGGVDSVPKQCSPASCPTCERRLNLESLVDVFLCGVERQG